MQTIQVFNVLTFTSNTLTKKLYIKNSISYYGTNVLKRYISDTNNRRKQITNLTLYNNFVTYMKGHYYHTTSVYLKRRKDLAKVLESNQISLTKETSEKKIIEVWRNMTVKELATSCKRDIDDVLEAIWMTDTSQHYEWNSVIKDSSVIADAVKKLGIRMRIVSNPSTVVNTIEKDHDIVKCPLPDESLLIKRRPVVTIMGHVDHGKTTLLDALRNSSVADTEFGGITQHIGAFNVELKTGEKITFLDTPGHAAFSSMRQRGAEVTDIVILVVAADDGVMEQTVQSIEMARSANVSVIVAINKIDKPNANVEKTYRSLSEVGINVEQIGGDVQCVNISALKKINLNTLIEVIALQADIIGLKGDPTGMVEATVIECTNDPYRGKLATVIVQRGTLRKGAILVSGLAWAKVRSMFDHAGKPIVEAKLSDAVQIMGWRALPQAGDEVLEVKDEQTAHMAIRYRKNKVNSVKALEHKTGADKKLEQHLAQYKVNLEKRHMLGLKRLPKDGVRKKESDVKTLPEVNIIIKGDVIGSVEAILDVIDTYTGDNQCRLNVVHYGIGNVTESDIELAKTFDAIVYRFNVNMSKTLQDKVKTENVLIRDYKVIYKLIEDIKDEINNKLPTVDAEEIFGEAKVLQEFEITEVKKKMKIAGCECVKGVLKKSALYHVIRNGEIIFTGKLASMRHLKEEVDTIKSGMQCGLRLDDSTITFMPDDRLVCFKRYKKKQQTDWDPGF